MRLIKHVYLLDGSQHCAKAARQSAPSRQAKKNPIYFNEKKTGGKEDGEEMHSQRAKDPQQETIEWEGRKKKRAEKPVMK